MNKLLTLICLLSLAFAQDKKGPGDGKDKGPPKDKGKPEAQFRPPSDDKSSFDIVSIINGTKYGVGFSFRSFPEPAFFVRRIQVNNDGDKDVDGVGIILFAVAEVNDTITPQQSRSGFAFRRLDKNGVWSPIEKSISTDSASFSTSLVGHNDPRLGYLNFTLSAAINTASYSIGGLDVNPSDIKFSIDIANYPFQYANSRLLIVAGIFSKNNTATVKDNSVSIGSGGFSWSTSYTVDGVDKVATVLYDLPPPNPDNVQDHQEGSLNDNESRIAPNKAKVIGFVFEGGQSISWDPKIGVQDDSTTSTQISSDTTSSARIVSPSISTLFIALLTFLFLLI